MKFNNVLIWGASVIFVLVLFFIQIKSGGFGSSSDKVKSPEITTTTMNNDSKLIIEDEVVGTGDTATTGSSITVHYVGKLTDSKIFDASRNHGAQGFTFLLGAGQVIKGWDQGVVGMKVGGKRKLTIPSELAYGSQAVGGVIPANATLIFEVELLKVGK